MRRSIVFTGKIVSKYFELRKSVPTEPMDDDAADLYPEIVAHGSLGRAIQTELDARGAKLQVEGFEKIGFPLHGATVRFAHRFCQVMIAAKERWFLADFWERGVLLVRAQTASVAILVDAISLWCAKQGTVRDMQSLSAEIVAASVADAYEAGPREMVQRQWSLLLESASAGHPELRPVLNEALKTPELSCLFPFISLVHLCFSRCTGYPFTNDCPHITPLSSGRFRVSDAGESTIGEGDAKEAIEMVVRNLPTGCSAAIHGTAEDVFTGP